MKKSLGPSLVVAAFALALAWAAGGASDTGGALELPENACAISCPTGTAYAEISGSVSCRDGFSPVCQCTRAEEAMASCEEVEPE
jgi:hypothetical protein